MKRLSDQTLYEILEVASDAASADIESACDRARMLYGPGSLATYSLMSPDEADLLTRRIDEAKRTLLDPDARARYDASLSQPRGEAKGAANGGSLAANGAASPVFAAFGSLPPVIPALQPPRAERSAGQTPVPDPAQTPVPDPAQTPAPDMAQARPAILLAAAAQIAGPPPEAPRPILLSREIPPPTPAPLPLAPPEPPVEILMPAGAVWTGDALRKVREARNITISQIAERTKVTRHHVENIEADRFSVLPAPVYLRGILLSLARELRLDGQRVARSYLDRAATASGGPGGVKSR